MRYRADHKEQSRAVIVRSAAAQLRARGVEAVRLEDVMRSAGMTNGGFYKHFSGKDEIIVEAIGNALAEVAQRFASQSLGLPRGEALRRLIDAYLSEEHLRNPERGCAVAALGSEITRLPAPMKRRIGKALESYEERLAPLMPGETGEERHAAFLILFSSMAGCLTAARSAVDKPKQRAILASGRAFFVRVFCENEQALQGVWK
jgi:TetR/AcrR family transcriptional repressor of nem operon